MMLAVRTKTPKPSYGLPSGHPSKGGHDLSKFVVGATGNLPPTWDGVKSDVAGAPGTLTGEDTQDIVRRVRDLLKKQGPSQESELLAGLTPQQVRRLRASSGSLAALVDRLPGFHRVREDRYSFLYYLSPEEDDCCSPDPVPSERGPPVAKGSDEGGKRDACSQTPCSKRAELECEVECAQEVAKLEQKLEAVQLDQAHKRETLRFKIGQRRIREVPFPPMPLFLQYEGEEEESSVVEEEEEEYPEAERTEAKRKEPRIDPGPKCGRSAMVEEDDYVMPGMRGSVVPDFYDMHLKLEWSRSSLDSESRWSSWGSERPANTKGLRGKKKAEAQIAKIVKMLIRREPNYTEAEMREWVGKVRRLKGGFSRLTLNAIVALVLDHMRMHCLRHCHRW